MTEKNQEIQFPVSLRDYFAAKAMQTELASCGGIPVGETTEPFLSGVAIRSYQMADAMLKARET